MCNGNSADGGVHLVFDIQGGTAALYASPAIGLGEAVPLHLNVENVLRLRLTVFHVSAGSSATATLGNARVRLVQQRTPAVPDADYAPQEGRRGL